MTLFEKLNKIKRSIRAIRGAYPESLLVGGVYTLHVDNKDRSAMYKGKDKKGLHVFNYHSKRRGPVVVNLNEDYYGDLWKIV